MSKGKDAARGILRTLPYAEHPSPIHAPHGGGRNSHRKPSRENSAPPPTEGRRTFLRPVGQGQHTTIPAWMSKGKDQPARLPRGLQQQGSFGTQMEPDNSPIAATAGQTGVIMRPFFAFRQKSLFTAGRTSIGCQK